MKTEIVKVTPELAQQMLKHNVGNRPLRIKMVNQLRSAFERGEYVTTHQGVAFSDKGALLDGQHRLAAIASMKSDASFPMLVTKGLEQKAFAAMDAGVKRSLSDALDADRRVVEVANQIAMICTGSTRVTPAQALVYVDLVQPLHEDLVTGCAVSRKTWSTAAYRTGAVVSLLIHKDVGYVKTVYRALCQADFDAMPPIAKVAFRSDLNHHDKFTSSTNLENLARALYIFNPAKRDMLQVRAMTPTEAADLIRSTFRFLTA